MLKSERQAFILQNLNTQGIVRVSDLATAFNVSPVTIRRDLAALEMDGKLHRVHGGALPREGQPHPTRSTNLQGRIAQAAARFVPDKSVVFLGPGTLTAEVVPFLSAQTNLSIITNALNIGWHVAQRHQHTLHIIGGQVEQDYGIYGHPEALHNIRIDWIILEASSIDAERGITHHDRDYANLSRTLFALSAQVIVLVAPENLGNTGALFIAPASNADILITGREAPNPPLWDLSELGVRIVLA